MRFMVMVKATPESEKEGALPDPQLMAEMGKYNEELNYRSFGAISIPANHLNGPAWSRGV